MSASAGRAEASTVGLSSGAKGLALSLGAAGLAGAVTVLGAAFAKSISLGRDYTSTLSELEAITGIAGEALDTLSDQALETSSETGRAASEIVEAYKLVASQLAEIIDFETEAGQRVLQGVAEDAVTLSQAAGIDLQQAVQATTTAINQFNLSAEQSTEVVNNLAAGSKFGAAEVGNIQAAMQEAGSAAAQAGEDITTTNAAIQVLAANAITGSKAGTGLRNVFLRLLTESDKLAELGINNVNLRADGLITTLEKLNPIADDAAALTEIFGQEAFNAASLLIRNRDALASLEGKLQDTNTATEQAAIQMDNLDGDVAKLSRTIQGDLIESFTEGESSFREFVQELTRLWEEFGDDFIFVLDTIVSHTATQLERWNKIWQREMDTTIDITEDSLLEMGEKIDAFFVQNFLGILERTERDVGNILTLIFGGDINDLARNISQALEEVPEIPFGAGVLQLPDNEILDSVDNVLKGISQVGDTYGIMATEAQLAQRALDRANQELIEAGNGGEGAAQAFVEFNQAIAEIDAAKIGNTFDEVTIGRLEFAGRSINDINRELEATLNQLNRLAVGSDAFLEAQQKAQRLRDEIRDAKDQTKEINRFAEDLGFTFSSAFEDAIVQGNSLSDVLNGILQDISRIILRTQVTGPLSEGLSGFLGGLFGGGGSETSVSDALITSEGDVVNFHPDDNILAMKDFSPIVQNNNAGGEVNINIINQNGSQVETRQRRNAGGGVDIDLLIKSKVNQGLNQGAFDNAMSANYNVNRSGV